tara:strand:- start:144 stop:941 length:798 start_codon:yes stop_codon:yes gene_type:complete
MKKYIVIGNPIKHSLSPLLHNYWIKKNKINAVYEKKLVEENQIKGVVLKIKNGEINGANVTIPFKTKIVPFLDKLTDEAEETKSVNTVYFENGEVIGHNTDIAGFELGIRHFKYDVKNKKVFINGAGGVVPSIIVALKKMGALKIFLYNRTLDKAKDLQNNFREVEIINRKEIPSDIDMLINASSLGLKKSDKINLDYKSIGSNKFFYDVIYNPIETNFLKKGKEFGNRTENGKMMFIYQAHQSFVLWHKILPKIDDNIIELLNI